MENNVEYASFFDDVVELLAQNENKLGRVRKLIEETNLLKNPTKKVLLGRIDNIFAESNAIVEKLGTLGKVK